jgi:hypothetical protein
MDYNIVQPAYMKTELAYRQSRIKSELAGPRRRRSRARSEADGLTWTKVR